MCGARGILPTSCTISDSSIFNTSDRPFASGALADTYEGSLNGSKVRVERVRMYSNGEPQRVKRVRHMPIFPRVSSPDQFLQMFCKEVIAWKYLDHKNLVPLLGVTFNPPQFVSVWMPGGDLTAYVTAYPEENRLRLVRLLPTVSGEILTRFASYMTLPRAWITSTPAM